MKVCARRSSGFLLALAAFIAAVFMAVSPVQAQSLDDLRASGAIAERYDGYVMVRSNSHSAAATVERVNAKRLAIYQARAAKQGITPEQVGRIYAKQIFQKAPPGTYFLNEDGQWSRK
ncbi:MAG: YdbL family protein [Rhodospirillales bacterium]